MEREIVLGDSRQNISLQFAKDGLWVSGVLDGHEIPHKMIQWFKFDTIRRDADLAFDPTTYYETLERERKWESRWPDMRSFLDATHHYFSRDHFRVEGRVLPGLYAEEHLLLLYNGGITVWDFGVLSNQDDTAWRVAFRRFEENVDRIQGRVSDIDQTPWWKRLWRSAFKLHG